MSSAITLKPETVEIIRRTAPVLREHGQTITTVFYRNMFGEHPELLNIFNISHQKEGRQPRALADTLIAAAEHIDRLEALTPAVLRIAHKHCSVLVPPEGYPIVGKHLLRAIKEVLGEAATPEILNAWAEAYQVLADIFIKVEEDIYHQKETVPGGWRGWRPFTVIRKVKESENITSFWLKPTDGGSVPAYRPGQYISVKADIPGESITHIRQYSLSDAPGKSHFRISVKREDARGDLPAGIVSNWLHSQIGEGDVLLLSPPVGDFFLDEEKETPVVLISGGVGLTPLVSMLNTLVESGSKRPITYIHAAVNGKVHAMKDHLREVAEKHDHIRYFVCYEKPTEEDRQTGAFDKEGFIDRTWLEQIIKDKDADFYFCGPVPFMKAIKTALTEMGIPADRIHYEFFGSALQI
ncbi:NO-inducible flavohemoprotein [Staphylospora marina]|uniref:NO-inducible flavohemoprotein n=1 Tax=Staphylospora marina TaxID=2490858 RepID=UPI000F5B8EB2|nr:NO-inducible flavohemoprotein [Staphylospora marina]